MSKGNEIWILKKYLHSHVHGSIIPNSQDMATTEVSVCGYMVGLIEAGGGTVIARDSGWRKLKDISQRIQAPSYKINELWVSSMVTIINNIV